MKKIFCLLTVLGCFTANTFSQNIGIGTTEPFNKLQVVGNFMITVPASTTSAVPTAGQTRTMVNATTITFTSDSTGRIYDPGGPAGDYLANMTAYTTIQNDLNSIGIELIAETMNLASGDSLIIKEYSSGATLAAVGNGYTTTGKWVFNYQGIYIIFKSNSDASVTAGFSLLFRRLYDNSAMLPVVSGNAGKGLYFDAKTGAFRSGVMDNSARGLYSVAMGEHSGATGDNSVALGYRASANGYNSFSWGTNSEAVGPGSLALGHLTYSAGSNSMAIGFWTTATGDNSLAAGANTSAGGNNSVAIGSNVTASGLHSTAMGYLANTNGHANSFVIGGTGTITNCTSPNQFMTRFDNYTFWISASNYAYLLPASNGWAYTSDRNKKERFEELDGESVLKKLSNIPLCSWNFKAADTREYRHYGITAQDFYDAFGRDSYGSIGNDTTVSPLDMLGVAYSAIKALEKRTVDQREENITLQKKLTLLEAKLNELIAVKEEDLEKTGATKKK